MLTIAVQTARPNGPNFFWVPLSTPEVSKAKI